MDALLLHPAVQKLAQGTLNSPWQGQLYLVGGCVRDALLHRPLKNDFDLVLEGDAVKLAEWLHEQGLCDHFPVVYPRFGTAMVGVLGVQFEFVTARKESYDPDSRKPFVEPATLYDDARRRDFTCNALAFNLHTEELRDPTGMGLADLKAGILRTPLEPAATFHDDPLRILRAVRFRAQLGFEFAEGLVQAIETERDRLAIISMERIREEFSKMILLPNADSALRDLMALGLFPYFAPEFEEMIGVSQGKWHHLDVWDHTLLVLRNAQTDDLILALACLLHDIAKPPTRLVDADGQIRFFGHESVGAEMARTILRRMRYGNEEIEAVTLLVKNHMRLTSSASLSTPATRRLIRDLGDQLPRLIELVAADASALKPGVKVLDLDPLREKIEATRISTPASVLRSPISGEAVMELTGLSPGPSVGKILHYLTEQVIEGNLAPEDTESARQMAKHYFESEIRGETSEENRQ